VDGEGGRAQTTAAPPRLRRTAQVALFWIALLVLVVGTVGGALIARDRALDDVDDRARRVAGAVSSVLEVELRQVEARMAGAAAVVRPDGSLDPDSFAAFAGDRVGGQRSGAMILLDIVPPERRAAWEQEQGVPITVVDGGRLVPASTDARTRYPAVAVAGAAPGRSITGVDFGADPARRVAIEAAVADDQAVVSAPLVLTSTGEPGVAVVRPVPGPDGTVRGLIATGIASTRLAEAIDDAAETRFPVALLDGDEVIVGGEVDDLRRRVVVPTDATSRRWRVAVRPGEPDYTVAWLVAAAGLIAILTTATQLILTERHHRRMVRANALLQRGEERSRAVQDVAGRLARALTGSEVASAVLDHLPAAVGGSSAVVALVERSGQLEVLVPGSEGRVLPGPVGGTVVEQVLSLRDPAWLASPLGWRDDAIATELAGDARALAVLPLLADDVVGVLLVGYPSLHIFGDDEQALLETVAVLAGQALARGRRYDAEHQAAVAFQRAALPDALPTVPGLSIAARYRPALQGATVGGDWYDALRLGDDRVLLVVGDVVGHGVVAAAAMGRLRTAFQTIVPYSGDPGSMLQGISQQIDSIPDAFCATVVSAVLDVGTGALTWSRAGHPPPLIASPGGRSRLLDAPCLPPLGVAPDQVAPVHHEHLAPGEVLVLYTDGVVERRDEALDVGFQRLAAVVEELVDLDVEDLADALVEAMVPVDAQTDDLAVLVVRPEPVAVRPGPGAAAAPAGSRPTP